MMIAKRFPRHRILVVDDNVDGANSLAMLLHRVCGQDVRVAYEGQAALREAEDFQPEIILLDIGLPGMDGYEVAHKLFVQSTSSTPRILVMSGWTQNEDSRLSMEVGIERYLVKPVELKTLMELLDRAALRGKVPIEMPHLRLLNMPAGSLPESTGPSHAVV